MSEGPNLVIVASDSSGIRAKIGVEASVAVVAVPVNQLDFLTKIGLSEKQYYSKYYRRPSGRTRLKQACEMVEKLAAYHKSETVSHADIDALISRGFPIYEIEAQLMERMVLEACNALIANKFQILEIILDAPKKQFDPPEYHDCADQARTIRSRIGVEPHVEIDADSKSLVSRASTILAYAHFKSNEDRTRATYGSLSDGHPNYQTKTWAKNYYAGYRSFSDIPAQKSSLFIKEIVSRPRHVIDIKWEGPSNFLDMGRGLSKPYLALRDIDDEKSEKLEYVDLKRLQYLDIKIGERRCAGSWMDGYHNACQSRDGQKLLGNKLATNREYCWSCSAKQPPSKCNFNPMCYGPEAVCGHVEFGANFCAAHQIIYTYIIGNAAKIGMGYHGSWQRLLEQGVSAALVLGIAPNRKIGRSMEKEAYEYLNGRISNLANLGITRVRQKTLPDEELVAAFHSNWDGEGDLIKLASIHEILFKDSSFTRNYPGSVLSDPFMVELVGDYLQPEPANYQLISTDGMSYLKANILGVRGPILYFDKDGRRYCMNYERLLRRRVIMGELSYDRKSH